MKKVTSAFKQAKELIEYEKKNVFSYDMRYRLKTSKKTANQRFYYAFCTLKQASPTDWLSDYMWCLYQLLLARSFQPECKKDWYDNDVIIVDIRGPKEDKDAFVIIQIMEELAGSTNRKRFLISVQFSNLMNSEFTGNATNVIETIEFYRRMFTYVDGKRSNMFQDYLDKYSFRYIDEEYYLY